MDTPVLTQIQDHSENLLPNLKRRKAELKMTNSEIADRTGISLDTVRKYFAGESKSPNVYNIMSMCILMGLSLDDLLGNYQVRTPEPVDHDNCMRVKSLEMEIHGLKTELNYTKQADELKHEQIKRLDVLLISVCSISVLFLICYMITDMKHPTVGFYQGESVSLFFIFSVLLICFCVFMSIRYGVKFKKRISRESE